MPRNTSQRQQLVRCEKAQALAGTLECSPGLSGLRSAARSIAAISAPTDIASLPYRPRARDSAVAAACRPAPDSSSQRGESGSQVCVV